ncbi:MAG: peptidoglycan-binding protein, partial [Gammaproteobacteria bacterium]|nr:peptidoglycan-binding protein [Gammaproteobacteria bacterium]
SDMVDKGDYVFPKPYEGSYQFIPRPAPRDVSGRILSVFGRITMIGQHDAVAVDLGRKDGIEPGHVLGVYQAGMEYRDPRNGDNITGYARRAGILIVYKSYDLISHAVVMEAKYPLRVEDRVANP